MVAICFSDNNLFKLIVELKNDNYNTLAASMQKTTKSLSIIIPAFNAEKYLAAALDSILRQSIVPLEVIIVDNLSTDQTANIARTYAHPMRLMSCARPGAASARNDALKVAKGEWITFLDADDIWSDDTLALFFKTVEENPSLDCVFGAIRNFRDSKDTTGGYFSDNALATIMPGATIMRRSAINTIGEFNEEYIMGSVIEWGFRIHEANIRMQALTEVVLHRRIHKTNVCKINKDKKKDYARIVKEALDRRRNAEKT